MEFYQTIVKYLFIYYYSSSDFDLKRVLEDFKNARSIPQAKITQRFSMPDWIDVSLAKRGQKFARDNLFSICICHAFGLTTMPHPDLVNILLFTGRLSSPEGATKRYLSTFTEIMSWYDEGLWGSRLGSHPTDVFTRFEKSFCANRDKLVNLHTLLIITV